MKSEIAYAFALAVFLIRWPLPERRAFDAVGGAPRP